jgi:hypothetical protein
MIEYIQGLPLHNGGNLQSNSARAITMEITSTNFI